VSERTAEHGPKYEIDVEGQLHPWDRDSITTAEIVTLVIEVNLQTQEERTLGADETVELKPGHGFGKKVKFKRGGFSR
jgi:uncharacterized membrane protein (UPF0127 family)